ncbi:15671_t:CDS:2 [Entrophospora sp. SA101]|nr:15669_t:CDS:2 [Entrophospora sp. SA101]CAJ0627922.1 15671_t:CDS:2 [Entrophospora sp. SA101]
MLYVLSYYCEPMGRSHRECDVKYVPGRIKETKICHSIYKQGTESKVENKRSIQGR